MVKLSKKTKSVVCRRQTHYGDEQVVVLYNSESLSELEVKRLVMEEEYTHRNDMVVLTYFQYVNLFNDLSVQIFKMIEDSTKDKEHKILLEDLANEQKESM